MPFLSHHPNLTEISHASFSKTPFPVFPSPRSFLLPLSIPTCAPSLIFLLAVIVDRHPARPANVDIVRSEFLNRIIELEAKVTLFTDRLRELDPAATEAASVPLSEVLPEYPPDAGEAWGMDPPQPPLGIGHYVRFGWSASIKALAIIPRFELSTAKARGVLPQEYSRKDLVCLLLLQAPGAVLI